MEDVRVSVIVPLYNCAPYIEECLGSLKAQTFGDFEVLCVDDCSTDDSLAGAKAAAADDPRFRFFKLEQNRGQSAARNVALDHAHGTYIVLLDADDYFVPDALEKLVARADRQNLDDLYFSAQAFYESKELFGLVREEYGNRPAFEEVATGKELFAYFEEHREFLPHAALRMVKRSLVEQHRIRFFEGIIHEDVLFTFQTLVHSQRSSYLNEPLYMRRIRANSTMTAKRTIANVRGHWVCVREMRKWVSAHAEELEDRFLRAASRRMVDYALVAAHIWFEEVDEADKAAYLDELDPAEKLDFYTEVVYPGAALRDLEDDIRTSRTYQVGNALLGVPRRVRDHMRGEKAYREERG
ncbi:glycosyltransferase family 2 protein [Raoultibacter phocaeensis]|uniref:glycosyltransferase family 2 protein n=1 Tax=Raoultibacter phocaeensis TaxID=2479841 RepID=UPI0015D60AEA|nr:glycosyltransferase family 2 protein [Raoultibacter phocaeensis]